MAEADSALWARAVEVLRENDLGGWTKAAPSLYPHQWSWDSAFIAIGLAHLSVERAADELRSLFRAQWATGMIPHIVFNPNVPPGAYFPDAAWWNCQALTDAAPRDVATSGICQPPVHAIAAWRIVEAGGDAAWAKECFPRLVAWHRYLLTARDPERSGLVTIYHPWESGMDNSPRWDAVMDRIVVGDLPPYERADLKHVADPSQRPTAAEYDRYLWLVEWLKRAHYDDAVVQRDYPFLVKDVFFRAIRVAANAALTALGQMAGVGEDELAEIDEWTTRGRAGLTSAWRDNAQGALDIDVNNGGPIDVKTMAAFAPLIAGGLDMDRRDAQMRRWDGPDGLGDERLRGPVPPSTSPRDPGFQPRRYWRGPTWPVMNWLFWWALRRDGASQAAAALRVAGLDQVRAVGFAEYVEPFTGAPLGSLDQSWTAAVVLDWLAAADA
jgi:glycogen debranching enzyme